MLVSVFLTSTGAFATTAPAGSLTVPVIVPVPAWPNKKVVNSAAHSASFNERIKPLSPIGVDYLNP
jgi:hypothetical protein